MMNEETEDAAEQRQTNSKLNKFLQNCKSILDKCPKL